MRDLILVDNDIALKLCAYSCAQELMWFGSGRNRTLAMLRLAQYTVGRRVHRARGIQDSASLQTQWGVLAAAVLWVEPTEEEIMFAAELEEQAMMLSLELDAGESQLFAILVHRMSPLLITGDKRAINALERIAHCLPSERVACLEQIVFTLLQILGTEILRKRICGEPGVDRSLSIAFACNSASNPATEQTIKEGLTSYVVSVQKSAPTILIRTTDLSAVVP
ncbi:hypothetical protein [Sinorhizobium alkalisoli]|uniref:Uncharacterized protein n=1 Tax=Sinorhizobium alkalisoli TaxID=1752398 RepID=A0A1E3VHY2_9HYPH|nr:hypothetical protein [Sinorhizobium alkalisoli]MCG5478634.1 hypothetical protein [Sinorhizobium alkalisoli]ODR93178.1 hypothetical protein A8M32_01265 [Sinorhizobium alkalisoli]